MFIAFWKLAPHLAIFKYFYYNKSPGKVAHLEWRIHESITRRLSSCFRSQFAWLELVEA